MKHQTNAKFSFCLVLVVCVCVCVFFFLLVVFISLSSLRAFHLSTNMQPSFVCRCRFIFFFVRIYMKNALGWPERLLCAGHGCEQRDALSYKMCKIARRLCLLCCCAFFDDRLSSYDAKIYTEVMGVGFCSDCMYRMML